MPSLRNVWGIAVAAGIVLSACASETGAEPADTPGAPAGDPGAAPDDGAPQPSDGAGNAGDEAPDASGTPAAEPSDDTSSGPAGDDAAPGDDGPAPADDDAAATPVDDPTGGAAPSPGADEGDWQPLVTAEWEIPARSEQYWCSLTTIEQDMYVAAMKPLSPLGTHHTVLTAVDSMGEDREFSCGAGTNGSAALFGSGVGSNAFEFPTGVAVHLKAGQQLLLNLHLFNVEDEPIRGMSGTLARFVPADEVEHEAEALLAGPLSLRIPPGEVTQQGQCTMSHDSTIVGVFPHMHQLGVHMKVTTGQSGTTIYDGPFDFDEQLMYPVDGLQVQEGDTVDVECTYYNDRSTTVGFGDSSLSEMCFAVLYRYPAANNPSLICPR